jgi:hypothetical protein
MREARPLQRQDGRYGTCGLALLLAAIGPAPARADGADGCLGGAWIAEVRAFVAEETGVPAPETCVRLASKERLDGLVFPAARGATHGETIAAVYVPATREILLADDLDPGSLLARSYLVHELVHAQQFTSGAHEHVQCPGVLEADAYGTQALYLSTWGLWEHAFLLQILGMYQSVCGDSY